MIQDEPYDRRAIGRSRYFFFSLVFLPTISLVTLPAASAMAIFQFSTPSSEKSAVVVLNPSPSTFLLIDVMVLAFSSQTQSFSSTDPSEVNVQLRNVFFLTSK